MPRSTVQVFTGLADEPFFISCRKKLRARNGAQAQKIVSVDELRLEREDGDDEWTTVLAEYAASNGAVVDSLFSGFVTRRRGQLFELTTRALITALSFDIQKAGSPTGDVTAELFASADESVPNGAPLASGTVDASTLSTIVGVSPALAFTLVALSSPVIVEAGWYAATVRYDGGDVSNRVDVGRDNTSSTHAGHVVSQALADDVWSASLTSDLPFRVTGLRMPPPSKKYRLVAECTLEPLSGFGSGQTEDVFRRPAMVAPSARNPIVAGIS